MPHPRVRACVPVSSGDPPAAAAAIRGGVGRGPKVGWSRSERISYQSSVVARLHIYGSGSALIWCILLLSCPNPGSVFFVGTYATLIRYLYPISYYNIIILLSYNYHSTIVVVVSSSSSSSSRKRIPYQGGNVHHIIVATLVYFLGLATLRVYTQLIRDGGDMIDIELCIPSPFLVVQ